MKLDILFDPRGAKKKTAGMRKFDLASRRVASRWAANTVKAIKEGLTGRILHVRSGKLRRIIGMKVTSDGPHHEIAIGTNVGAVKADVVYARIHEEGGWIYPRNARALTIPLAGTKGLARNFPNMFIIKPVTGHALLCQRTGKSGRSWRARFMLVGSVKMPARHWFTIPLTEQQPELRMMMSDEYLYAEAMAMAYGEE